MKVPPSLYSWEAAAKHPLLYSFGGAIVVLVLMPLGAHWIDSESWAFSIIVGVGCSLVIFFAFYRKLNPEKPPPPLPPWLGQPPSEDE